MSKMSELAAASDLADLIKGQASAMNQTMMNGYDAGLQEGFRRGIQAAAAHVEQVMMYPEWLAPQIRALKLSEALPAPAPTEPRTV